MFISFSANPFFPTRDRDVFLWDRRSVH
nr:photosystem I assembly protein Ycf4 [Helleborus thibetanus]